MTPGPRERSLRARLHWRLFGCWPRSVVDERLANTTYDPSDVNTIKREIYEQAYGRLEQKHAELRRRLADAEDTLRDLPTADPPYELLKIIGAYFARHAPPCPYCGGQHPPGRDGKPPLIIGGVTIYACPKVPEDWFVRITEEEPPT